MKKRAQSFKQIDQEGYSRLQNRLEILKQELIELQEQIRIIKGTDGNDLFDSPAYLQAKVQAKEKVSQISKLEEEIGQLVVVQYQTNSDTIVFGNKVTLEIAYSPDDIETDTFTFVSSSPDTKKNEISQRSPIGMFIAGKKVGDCGEVKLPNNQIAKIKIINKE